MAVRFVGLQVKGAGRKSEGRRYFYLTVDGQPEEIMVETLDQILLTGGANGAIKGSAKEGVRPPASRPGHVSVTMPCVVVEVRVTVPCLTPRASSTAPTAGPGATPPVPTTSTTAR